MKYIPITFIFIFLVNNIIANEFKDYIFEDFASSKLGTIKISENERFSSYNSEGMWKDSEGDYGTEFCSGYVKEFNKNVSLEVYCETKNQDGDIFWNSRIRSSEKGGGIGKIKFLNGTGKYKKYIGLECPYGIVYQAEHAWFKAKCKIKN